MCISYKKTCVRNSGRVFKTFSYIVFLEVSKSFELLRMIYQHSHDTPRSEKLKQSFAFGFNIYKSKHLCFRKGKQNVPQKRFHSNYIQDCHRGIDDREVTLFEKYETNKQIQQRKTFWQHKLKTFYTLGLNEKEEYLFQSHTVHKSLAFIYPEDQIFYPQNDFDNTIYFYLIIYSLISFIFYFFIYLSIYLFFIYFNNNRT